MGDRGGYTIGYLEEAAGGAGHPVWTAGVGEVDISSRAVPVACGGEQGPVTEQPAQGSTATQLVAEALSAGQSVVVDNTNPAPEDRAALLEIGRRLAARVIGFYFEPTSRSASSATPPAPAGSSYRWSAWLTLPAGSECPVPRRASMSCGS